MSSCVTNFIFTFAFPDLQIRKLRHGEEGWFPKVTVCIWNQAVLAPTSICTGNGYKYNCFLLCVRKLLESAKHSRPHELIPTSRPLHQQSPLRGVPSLCVCLTGLLHTIPGSVCFLEMLSLTPTPSPSPSIPFSCLSFFSWPAMALLLYVLILPLTKIGWNKWVWVQTLSLTSCVSLGSLLISLSLSFSNCVKGWSSQAACSAEMPWEVVMWGGWRQWVLSLGPSSPQDMTSSSPAFLCCHSFSIYPPQRPCYFWMFEFHVPKLCQLVARWLSLWPH